MKRLKKFAKTKDLRLFVKNFFKEHLRGMPDNFKVEIHVSSLDPPEVKLYFPFYSEGNPIRSFEVDFLLGELYNLGIRAQIYYLDEEGEREWI